MKDYSGIKISNQYISKKFYRNNINSMSEMFSYCNGLKEINLSKYNTSYVSNMNSMFFIVKLVLIAHH